MTSTHSGRPLLVAALLGLALSTAPSLAQAKEGGSGRLNLTPAQQQKLYPEWRKLTLEKTQAQIAILQKHQQCVTAAGSMDALQACKRQQHQAQVEQHRQQRQAMRQLLQRNGITPPSPREDGGKRKQSDSVPMI